MEQLYYQRVGGEYGVSAYSVTSERRESFAPYTSKGAHDDSGTYVPVSLLPHAQKVVDASRCSILIENFTPTTEKFLKPASQCSRKYPRFKTMWSKVCNTQRCWNWRKPMTKLINTLETQKVTTKDDRYGYTAQLTIGVPQGAPSSPVYFNAYIDDIGSEMHRLITYCGEGRGAATLIADDCFLQTTYSPIIQEILCAASL